MKSAPRLSPRLLDAIERLDDGSMPFAELRRRVGAEADRLGLPRPSYQRVRTLAREHRAREAEVSLSEVYLRVAARGLPATALLDHVAGVRPDPAK